MVTPETEQEITRLFKEEGLSGLEIGRRLGIGRSTIQRVLDRLGLARGAWALSTSQRDAAVAAALAGVGTENVAKAFGICRSTLQKLLREAKVRLKDGPKRIVDDDTARAVVEAFENGATEAQLAERFGIGKSTARRTLLRAGVTKPKHRAKPRVADSVKQAALSACVEEGTTRKEAALLTEISESTVRRILQARNIRLQLGRPPSAGIDLDHFAFEVVTRQSAYWMGFICADGALCEDGYGAPTLEFNIQERDVAHIEKLKIFLRSKHAITQCAPKNATRKDGHIIKSGPSISFHVRSEQLAADLVSHGIDWGKTERVDLDPLLVESPDFWRGCVDGDGWVTHENAPRPAYSLAGSTSILQSFRIFLHENGVHNLNLSPTDSGIFRIGTEGRYAHRILKLLYGHGGTALNRKKERADSLIEQYEQSRLP